jgi:hypothetical protein
MQRTDEEADKSDGNPQDKQDNGARIDLDVPLQNGKAS